MKIKSSDYLNVVLQGNRLEHNLQAQIEQSGFTPKVLSVQQHLLGNESGGVSTAFFSIREGEEPRILSNYIFENEDMRRAHILLTTTQELQTSITETTHFKILQLHFINSELSYSIVYVNVEEWFRYEVNAFVETVHNFQVMIDGEMQPHRFFQQSRFSTSNYVTQKQPPGRRESVCTTSKDWRLSNSYGILWF